MKYPFHATDTAGGGTGEQVGQTEQPFSHLLTELDKTYVETNQGRKIQELPFPSGDRAGNCSWGKSNTRAQCSPTLRSPLPVFSKGPSGIRTKSFSFLLIFGEYKVSWSSAELRMQMPAFWT